MIQLVFPEGDDPRLREAAEFLHGNGLAEVIILTGADDLPDALALVREGDAQAVITFAPAPSADASAYWLLERTGEHGRPERVILTDQATLTGLDAEKLLGVQPRLTVVPYQTEVATALRNSHPLWLVGEAADLDNLNTFVVTDASTRQALAVVLQQFGEFRLYGPIYQGPGLLMASLAANATVADVISTAEYLAKLT